MGEIFFVADVLGIIAFALSGFLAGVRKELDMLGLLITASLTALGGGIVRDVILNKTPFAFSDYYPSLSLLAALLIALLFKLYRKPEIERRWLFVISDTIGLVAFSITGALLAMGAEFNLFGVLILSFLTAVGGGVIRDMLINELPVVLKSDFYGSVALIAALCLMALNTFDMLDNLNVSLVALFCIALRLVAYKRNWHLPTIR